MSKPIKVILTAILIVLLAAACSTSAEDMEDTYAILRQQVDSGDDATFKRLNLGMLFDFELELPHADESWVYIWVERYSMGKKEEQPIISLSYGLDPSKRSKGMMGFAVIKGNSGIDQLLLYSPTTSTGLIHVEDITIDSGANMWGYTSDKPIVLKSGEEKTLAFYRQVEATSIETLDPADEKQLQRMIEQDNTVLLMKIKVEKKDGLD